MSNRDKIILNNTLLQNNQSKLGTILTRIQQIPAEPTGTLSITENGIYDVKDKANVDVNVQGGEEKMFTGHYDSEGLKQIGWTDEDIEYYQKNGVFWNEEDDDVFKLLPNELAGDNTSNTRFIPKNTTLQSFNNFKSLIGIPSLNLNITSAYNMFNNCYLLVTIPKINTANVTTMNYMFYNCYSLVTIPEIDTANDTQMDYMFYKCYLLVTIPEINTANVKSMYFMFNNCYSLVTIPKINTANVLNMSNMFNSCYSLKTIPKLDTANVINIANMCINCIGLINLGGFENLGQAYLTTSSVNNSNYTLTLSSSILLTHKSLMNVINNLYDIKTKGCNPQKLVLGNTNLAKLTAEEIAIATSKGWTVS